MIKEIIINICLSIGIWYAGMTIVNTLVKYPASKDRTTVNFVFWTISWLGLILKFIW